MLRSQSASRRLYERKSGEADPKAKDRNSSLVSLGKLAEAKQTAFRRGVWFRVLNRLERGVVDLTMKYVNDVKSTKLAKVLTAIMDKLSQATESMVDRLVRTVGVSLAQKISSLAVSWGNLSASKWAADLDFARYLAFNASKT